MERRGPYLWTSVYNTRDFGAIIHLFSSPLHSHSLHEMTLTVKVKRLLLPFISRLRDVPASRWPSRATWYDVGGTTMRRDELSFFLNRDEPWSFWDFVEGRATGRPVPSQAGISFNSSLTSNRDFYGTMIGNHGISSWPTLLSRPPDPLYWRFYWKGRVNLGIGENGSSFQSDKYIIISWYCFEN